jgi:hypothetical protein
LVEPAVGPARASAADRASANSTADRDGRPGPAPDDLDAALASAREAAAAAQRTVDRLDRLARSRGRPPQGPRSPGRPSASVDDALDAARAASLSLRAALAAEPDNVPLARALEETSRAIKLLEEKTKTPGARRDSPAIGR